MAPADDGHDGPRDGRQDGRSGGRHSADDGVTDDARVDYLSGDQDVLLDEADQAELDELRALLADPTIWVEPPADLENSVVAIIAAERAATRSPDPAVPAVPADPAVPVVEAGDVAGTIGTARGDRFPQTTDPGPLEALEDDGTPIDLAAARERRVARDTARGQRGARWRWARPGILVAAAAAVAAVALTGVLLLRDTGTPQRRFDVALSATELAPGAAGDASMVRTDSGWEIHLQATGLPRLDNGAFYQAWLRNADGVLVPIGSFNEGTDVTLWSGVSPESFSTFTITRESADGHQDSSGQRVMSGSAVEQP